MLSQQATIVETAEDYLLLEPEQAGCNACDTGKNGGCGVTNLSAFFQQRSRQLKVSNPGNFYHGQQVEILLAERLFLLMLAIQYLLPLLTMLLFAVAIGLFSDVIISQLIAVVLGLFAGVRLSRWLTDSLGRYIGPETLAIRPVSESENEPAQFKHIKVLLS